MISSVDIVTYFIWMCDIWLIGSIVAIFAGRIESTEQQPGERGVTYIARNLHTLLKGGGIGLVIVASNVIGVMKQWVNGWC